MAKFNRKNVPFERIVESYRRADPTPAKCAGPKNLRADAFALRMKGDFLSPRVKDGQLVVVDARIPKSGELAVFWPKKGGTPAINVLCHDVHGYPLHPGSEVVPLLRVKQLNPPREFYFAMDKIECIARVAKILPANTLTRSEAGR